MTQTLFDNIDSHQWGSTFHMVNLLAPTTTYCDQPDSGWAVPICFRVDCVADTQLVIITTVFHTNRSFPPAIFVVDALISF